MEKTKIYRALSILDSYEWNRFKKFVFSPYFNQNESLRKMTVHLQDYMNSDEIPDKEELWHLFNEEPYDDLKFRKYCSDLVKLLQDFLVQEQFTENPLHQANYLLKWITKRRLNVMKKTAERSARRLSSRQLEKAASYYYYQYQLEKSFFDLHESELNRVRKMNVEAITRNLDYFYIAEKLRYYCTALSQKEVAGHVYKIPFMEEILEFLENNEEILQKPQIHIYYLIYKVYTEPEEDEPYQKLRHIMTNNMPVLPVEELKDIYTTCLNFCTYKINNNRREYLQEFLDVTLEGLRNEALYVNDELTPWTFKNVVLVALRLKKYEWADRFIENYQEKLNPNYRENAVTFNQARIAWYRKDFDRVLELLREVEFDDFSYSLGSKAMMVATYFETEEIEVLLSFIDSFRTYLKRHKNKIPEKRRQNYLNLLKFVNELLRTPAGDVKANQALHKKLLEEKNVSDKQWLSEKIRERLPELISSE